MDNGQKFRSIVAAILQVAEEDVDDSLSPDKVDTWDSLNHINLLGALEQEFGVRFEAENLEKSQSIPALKELLAKNGVSI